MSKVPVSQNTGRTTQYCYQTGSSRIGSGQLILKTKYYNKIIASKQEILNSNN